MLLPCGWPREKAGTGTSALGWREELAWGRRRGRSGKGRGRKTVSTGGGSYQQSASGWGLWKPRASCVHFKHPLCMALLLEMSVVLFLLKTKWLSMGLQGLIPWCPILGLSRALLGGPWHAAQEADTGSRHRKGLIDQWGSDSAEIETGQVIATIIITITIYWTLCARCCTRCFTYIWLFYLHSCPISLLLFNIQFREIRRGHGTESYLLPYLHHKIHFEPSLSGL